jgi:hypothetical protein
MTKLIVAFRNFANKPKNRTNAVSAVRIETLTLTTSVSSAHGPVHWTAGRVLSVIGASLHESFSKSDILINVNLELSGGHAMVGTVSHRLFTAETQVRSHDLCCWDAAQQTGGPVAYILPLEIWDCGKDI